MAVRVGVGGEVPAVGSKRHCSYGPFVTVDRLARGERTEGESVCYCATAGLNRLASKKGNSS